MALTSAGTLLRPEAFHVGVFSVKNISQLSPQELAFPSSSNCEHVRMLMVSATHTLSPTLLGEFRFGCTDDIWGTSNPFNGRAFSNSVGLRNISQDIFFNGVTEVDFSGLTSGLDVARLDGYNQARTREFSNNLTWIIVWPGGTPQAACAAARTFTVSRATISSSFV
jgi:hypothetical protein